jgi:hypothetical protein
MSAIIPLTIKVTLTNIPKKANPTSIPMLLSDSLIAVWFMLSAKLMTSLVEMSVGMDSAREATREIDGNTILMLATRRIPPTISII